MPRDARVEARGSFEWTKDMVGGCDAVGARVELHGDVPQGRVQLGCEHEDRECRRERHATTIKTHADLDRHDGRAQGRRELEHQRREERQPEGRHRPAPVLLTRHRQTIRLDRPSPERTQRREALHDVQEMTRELAERGIACTRSLPGGAADEYPEDGDERQGQRHHDGGDRVQRDDTPRIVSGTTTASTSCGR